MPSAVTFEDEDIHEAVKAHRARVMDKMRAGSVAELVRLADVVGVVVPQP